MSNIKFVTSRAFAISGIDYTISVYQTDGNFTAFCDCHSCPTHRMTSSPTNNKDGAITMCEELIRQHHADVHGADSSSVESCAGSC
jgi:hypothetical protein